MNKFTAQILNDSEFDSLPYKNISDSLGFADPKKGLAFVRDTGVKEFNLATLSHEIDHLVEKNTNHTDEFGIAHKKGKDVFARIIPLAIGGVVTALTGGGAAPLVGGTMASLLGGAASAGTSAITQKNMSSSGVINPLEVALSGVGSGMMGKGVIGGVNASKAMGGGILGQTLSGAQGALGLQTGAQKALTAQNAAFRGVDAIAPGIKGYVDASGVAGPSISPSMNVAKGAVLGGAMSGVPRIEGAFAQPGLSPSITSNAMTPNFLGASTASNVNNIVGGGVPTAVPKTPMENIGSFASQPANLLGAGALATSMAPKTPQFEMPSGVADLRAKLMSGEALSPLGQQARTSLSEIMAAKPTELYAPMKDEYYQATLRRTRSAYEEAQKNLDKAYNVAGVYGSGEHLAAKDKLAQQLTNAETDLYAQTEQRNFELARTEKFKAMQEALGVDKDQLSDIVGLTGLDVQTAAMIYGAQVEDVKQIRESLGTLGIELLSRQGKMQGTPGIDINVGR